MAPALFVPTGRPGARWARQSISVACLVLAALTAQAQAPGKAARPDPLDAGATVPALRWASSLPVTRRPGDDQPISWRDANDTVARIGGWRVYAREAPRPDPLPAASTGPRP